MACRYRFYSYASALLALVLMLNRFRWVTCQIDALEDCLDYPTLRSALDSLPTTLDKTYARIIKAIPANLKQTALRILQFLTFSERPLKIEEAVDAIAVDVDKSPHFSPRNRMPEPLEITRYCSSLVVVVSAQGHRGKDDEYVELQLAHFSVKEYLTSQRLDVDTGLVLQELPARASIARVCLAYLLHFDQVLPLKKVLKDFPFAQYCAMYWMSQAQVAGCEGSELLDLIERLFCYETSSYQLCYYIYRPDEPWLIPPSERDGLVPALYYAAFGGLKEVVKLLLEKGADVNAQGGYYGNALQAASWRGHEAIVKLLLDKGANINAQGGYYGNALYAASGKGYEAIVKLLLDKGADVNAQDEYSNALHVASDKGHEAVVRLLLDKGADTKVQDGYNALYTASSRGREAIVKLLLDKGADVNAQGRFYRNTLYAASSRGHEAIVKLLLDKGADVNARGGFYGNALYTASSGGHETIVKLLLDKGADVNAQCGYYGNALYGASDRGHEAIVKLLLDKGADVNARGGFYGNALHAASSGGHEAIMKLLIRKAADLNKKSNDSTSTSLTASG